MYPSIPAASGLAVAVLGVALLAPRAEAFEDAVCSNASLYGDYAFTIEGQIFTPGGTAILRRGVALTRFDGHGGLLQSDFVMQYPDKNGGSSPVPGKADPTSGFNTGEQGHYVVFQDCTGDMEIDFPPLNAGGAVIKARFVLGAGGRAIHTIVYSVQPPNSSTAVPAVIHSDGRKLGYVAD